MKNTLNLIAKQTHVLKDSENENCSCLKKQHGIEIIKPIRKTKETGTNMDEDLQQYPEKNYFRNSIVIGDLPINVDLNKLLHYFDDISFWKLNGKRVIPDLRKTNSKAVILTYGDEESARACNLQLKAVSNMNFTLYDGISLFHYCKQLDLFCDFRCRNVLLSGIDCDKSRETYLDILGEFGTISYFEFCPEGNIPKARIEFTRATSAFAAVLSLEGKMDRDSVITLEMSLFPVFPIGPIERNPRIMPIKKATIDTRYVTEDMKQAFMLCTMNIYQQDQHTYSHFNGLPESTIYQRESIEECMMEAVSFGISKKLFKEKLNSSLILSRYIQEYFDKGAKENIKRFLQSTKKIMFQ